MTNAEFDRQLRRIEDESARKREQVAAAKQKLEGDESLLRSIERA